MRIIRILAALGLALGAAVSVPQPAVADEIRDSQWYLETLNIAEAHKLSTGKGVTVGVIDTGVDATHPDLAGSVTAGRAYGSLDDPLTDPQNHGTSVAAIVAGQGDADGILGIAPDAKIVSVGIDWTPQEAGSVADWQLDAINYLVDSGVDIIVTSLNTSNGDQRTATKVIDHAMEQGVPVISSAGNRDENGDGRTRFPAAYENVIPVVGTTQDGSPWSDSVELWENADLLGVSAPAEDIPAAEAGGGYSVQSGTTGAAPIVAGTFALVKSIYPDLDWANLVNRVLGTVDDEGEPGLDKNYGLGIINPVAALTTEIEGQETGEPETAPEDGDADSATDGGDVPLTDNTTLVAIIAVVGVLLLAGLVFFVRSRDGGKKGGKGDGDVPPPQASMSAPPTSGPPSPGPPTYTPPRR